MKDFLQATPPLRHPDEVMRLSRMGSAFPTRLSFLRVVLRKLKAEGARVTRPVWNINQDGYGHAVYSVDLSGYTYSLVAVVTPLPPEKRTDRVIAEAWDAAFVLYDGVPSEAEIARIVASAPKQEAARFSEKDLVLSRANKSVRLFNHVVERLRAGQQPDKQMILDIGYLMRTTAVYGNGKFGIADRGVIADRPGLGCSFMVEMLTVLLIRAFTHDLAEFLGGHKIERALKRHLGIGNSTGLGMAPFLVSHPELVHRWVNARESALARVRAIEELSGPQAERLLSLAKRAARHLEEWHVPDPDCEAELDELRKDWSQFSAKLPALLKSEFPVSRILEGSRQFGLQCQELAVALCIEPFPDLVDDLAETLYSRPQHWIDPRLSMEEVRAAVDKCIWATGCDFSSPEEVARFWYVSEEKQEPRIGERAQDAGAELERPLDIARQIKALAGDLHKSRMTFLEFLQKHPHHRGALSRVLALRECPYAEIRDNLIAKNCRPIDMLRFKLAFFGATKFDPKSDLWTRIALAQGAPLVDELESDLVDDWWLAVLE